MIEIPKQLQQKEFKFVKLGIWNEWARYEKDEITKKPKIVEKRIVTPENFNLIDKKIWKPLGKAPFETKWETKNYSFDNPSLIDHINKGLNFGIIGGFGNLVILDIDDPKLAEEFEKKLDTYTIKTGSGGKHFYFIVEDLKC